MISPPPDDTRAPAGSSHVLIRIVLLLGGLLIGSVVVAAWAWAAPAAPGFTSGPTVGNDPTPTWTWTASTSDTSTARIGCTLTHVPSSKSIHAAPDCGTTYEANLNNEATGQYRMAITAYDAANAPSPTVTSEWNYTGPPPPTVTAGQGARGSSQTVSWSFTYSSGNTPTCQLQRDGAAAPGFAACTSPVSYTLPSIDGLYTFSIKTNVSTPISSTYVLDTTGPTITLAAPAARGNSTTPGFTLGGGEAGASYFCTLKAPGGATTNVNCAPGTVTPTLTGGAQGTWTLSAFAKDDLLNPGGTVTATYLLDTVGPTVTLTGPPGPSKDLTPDLTLGGETGTEYFCTLKAPDGTTSDVDCAPGTVTPTLDGQQGIWTLYAYAEDDLTNPGATVSWEYVLDTIDPGATLAGPGGAATGPSKVLNPTFGWTGEDGAGVACSLTDPDGVVTALACGTGSITLSLPASGGDGTWTVTVTVTDAAGNSSTRTATYLLDTIAPAATLAGPGGPATGPSKVLDPSFTWTREPGAGVVCSLTDPDGVVTALACGTGSITLSLPASGGDGTWTVTVTVTDAAGNSTTRTATYLLDTIAPAATLAGPGGPATGPSKVLDPSFTWTREPGAGVVCSLTDPDGVVTALACGTGSITLSLPASGGDGTWTVTVTVTDAAGNSSTRTATYLLDTIAPAATLAGPGGPATGPSKVLDPSFTWTREPGAGVVCSLTDPDGVVTALACGTGSITLSLPASGGDGTWTVTVTVTDAAGNSTTRTATYLLDTIAPGATLAGPGGAATGPSKVLNPTFAWTGEDGAGVACSLTSPTGTVTVLACGTGSITLSLPASGGDGTWTVTVTVTDAAGNSSTRTATYLLDTIAPGATLAGPNGPATGPSKVLDPSFTWTREPGAGVVCSLTDPDGVVTALACGTGSITLSLPASGGDGTWTVTVTVTDAAGNSSTRTATYLLDTIAPGATLAGPNGPATGPSKVLDPSFTWTREPGAGVVCSLTDPDGVVTALACGTGSITLSLPASGGDGTWTVTVTVTDAAGNSTTRTATYLLDTIAPAAGVSGPTGPSSNRTPTFSLTGETGGTFGCTLTSPGGVSSALACAVGDVQLNLPAGQDGTWLVTVTVTDAAGNSSTRTVTYLLDTTAPGAPAVAGPTGPSKVQRPTFSLEGEDGAVWSCMLAGPDGSSRPITCSAGDLVVDLSAGPDGVWTLTVTVTDAAGTSTSTVVTYRLDTAAPSAPSITGPSGAANDRTPGLVLGGEAGGTFSCVLTSPDGRSTTVACDSGAFSPELDGADGVWTLTVTVTDTAGNRSAEASHRYLLDTTAPTAAGVTGPAGPSKQRAPTFVLTGEAGASYSCTLTAPDGAVIPVSCAAGAVSAALAGPDGLWTLTVTLRDAAGNTSPSVTYAYALDTTAPTAPGVSAPRGPSNIRTPAVQLSGESGGTFTCVLTAPGGSSSEIACGAGDLALVLSGPDGIWLLTVTVTDVAGNISAATTTSYLLDTTAPGRPAVTAGPPLTSKDDLPVVLEGDGATLTCTLVDPTGAATAVPCSTGPVALDLRGPDGTYELRVVATDDAGNTSEATVWRTVRDTTPPNRPGIRETETGAFVVDAEDGSTLSCTLTGPDGVETAWPCDDGWISISAGDLSPGTWLLRVRATDAAGNSSEVARMTFEVSAPSEPAPPTEEEEPVQPAGEVEAPPVVEENEAQTPIDVLREVVAAVLPVSPVLKVASAVAEQASVRALGRLGGRADLSTRWRATLRVLQDAAVVGGIPLLLLLLVIGFLALQDRIDKNDPKLALAPVFSHQELPFRPLERFAS